MDCIKRKVFALGSILLKKMVHPNATKTVFSEKNLLKKGFISQCGTGQICFHWPNLFSLARSFFTGLHPNATKTVFFSEKSFVQKRLYFTMWDRPNLFSLAKSIFISQIFFHWFTSQCHKNCFFRKILRSKKAISQCGTGRIYFQWQIYFH